jgi:DNA-binding transcriptional LysR family regulator
MCPSRQQSTGTEDPLQGINTFVQVVEAGSFVLAAKRLRVTRSAVAKVIGRLERRLGAQLFHRTTRRQGLTESGQAYYDRCKRALEELGAAEAVFDDGRREPSGRLRVSAPVVFGRHYVAPVLTALASRYARLTVDLSFSDRTVDLMDEGFDLAVRIGLLPNSTSLAARRLTVHRFVMCASPSYLGKHGHPRSAEDFTGRTGITYLYRGPDMPWQMLGSNGKLQELRIERRLRFDDVQAIADAAIAGAGIARLPHWLAEPYVRAGQLVLLKSTEGSLDTEIHALWPHTRYMPAKTRAAVDALAEEIPTMLSATADAGRPR